MDAAAKSRLAAALAAESDVVFAYLFGSEATGRAGSRSDLDVGVHLGTKGPPDRAIALMQTAQDATGREDIDLVVLNTAPLTLAFEILKGELLFSRDEGERVAVEAAIMSEYLDREPHMRRHLASARERMRERGLA